MESETLERWLAWIIVRAALTKATYPAQFDAVINGLHHYAQGTALSRDYRAIRGF